MLKGMVMRKVVFLSALLCTVLRASGALDQNGNQQSDVWEAMYDATNLPPATDSDGDGVPNQAESIAGTDPYDALSFPAIDFMAPQTGVVKTAWDSQAGKTYTLEAADDMYSPWLFVTNVSGSNASLLASMDLSGFTQRLFRVLVGDVYSDNSGLSDWEKLQAGLSLSNEWSNGRFDAQGNPLSDYAYATNQLAAQNFLSIIASDLTTVQPDAGTSAQDPASFTIVRGGFPFHSITGNLVISGTAVEGIDFEALPHALEFPAGVISETIMVTPKANTNLRTTALATMSLQPGAGYALGSPSNASVVISPSTTAKGTGLFGQYYDATNASYSSGTAATFTNAVLKVEKVVPTVNFVWSSTNLPDATFTTNITFLVRWSGQVQPQYSEPYYFVMRSDDGLRLRVNGQMIVSNWANIGASDRTSLPIDLQAGVRYDIVLEYYQNTGNSEAKLSWYSPSQAKQIIPQERLYPTNTIAASAPAIVSSVAAYAILGYPFTNNVAVNNGAAIVSVGPMPPGLVYTASNKLISGVPTLAGKYQINILATNAAGTVQSVLDLTVIDTGAVISRDVWTNVAGNTVADIPIDLPPDISGQLATLEGPTDFGDNYAERWRGYLTAPISGNYYFWIAASDAAELWIANDGEQVNKVKRCWVAPTNATGYQSWTNFPSQKSPWLALVGGQRYYIELLHKAGTNAGDNVAVGWVRPDETNALPSGVVPGQVLSPYIGAIANASSGTLYTCTMLAQGTAISPGVGTATLVLSPDETYAILKYSYTNLTSPENDKHIHSDPYLIHPSQIIFDIDEAEPEADGSYRWDIVPVGTLSVEDILEVIKTGKSYINIHSVNYPAGEIRGNFSLAIGASSFDPPPAPPVVPDDHTSSNAASRFLTQATFGPSLSEIEAVRTMGYEAWIDDQFARPATHYWSYLAANPATDPNNRYTSPMFFNRWWQNAVTAPDQLRQRVAFALSQIVVVSDSGDLNYNGRIQAWYYDMLVDNAFGNFREILERVTLSTAMGRYLDMVANDKGNIISGTHPNENYAREILQLFSIGLYRLWPDGTLVMNSKGTIVPTYDQREVNGYAAVFTGWNYHQTNLGNGRLPLNWYPSYPYSDTNDMTLVPTHHDMAAKRILDNVVLPRATGLQTNVANVEYDNYGLQELEVAHDSIFNNQSVGPFICRQLIQRLVTSHPSREYLYRVVQKFNDNGAGVRGDMQAVIKAILLDYEARSSSLIAHPTFGKQREPLLRATAVARAFPAPPATDGTYSQSGTQTITITLTNKHKQASGAIAKLTFTSGSPLPSPGQHTVSVTGSNTLTVTAKGLATCAYSQTGTVIAVTNSSHGLSVGDQIHLTFTTGGATAGVYQLQTVPTLSSFTVTAIDSATRNGACVFPRHDGAFIVENEGTSSNRIRMVMATYPALNVSDSVRINFTSGIATDGVYVVSEVVDEDTFYVETSNQVDETGSSQITYPLVAPPLTRSGNVSMDYSTWLMDYTDNELQQTPLNSPTVFNYFLPSYKFSGLLASAGLTTPEFQLSGDTTVANQNNFLAGAVINSQGTNTSGLSSFKSGSEAITIDLSPWTSTNYASTNGISVLTDSLATLLMGGQLSSNARTKIVTYCATGITYNATNPTSSQIRDRVRGVVHQLIVSPDFTIQR